MVTTTNTARVKSESSFITSAVSRLAQLMLLDANAKHAAQHWQELADGLNEQAEHARQCAEQYVKGHEIWMKRATWLQRDADYATQMARAWMSKSQALGSALEG